MGLTLAVSGPGCKTSASWPGSTVCPASRSALRRSAERRLRGVVVAEDREAMVVQPAREVGDVGAEHEVPDLDRLVPGRVAGGQQQADRPVAEEVVVAVDELDRPLGVAVVAGEVEVALDRGVVVPGGPFGALDHDRHRGRDERQRAGVVEVQVGEHHPGERGQVDLVGDAQLLLQLEGADAVQTLGVKPGVDEDALGLGLDQVGRDREADRLLHVVTGAHDPRGDGGPADVEHLDVHERQGLQYLRRVRLLAALPAIAALGVAMGPAAAPAAADVVWACKPGQANDICLESLTTTVYEPGGGSRVVQAPIPANPPVDCFYVYPTVSNQVGPNATKTLEPGDRGRSCASRRRGSPSSAACSRPSTGRTPFPRCWRRAGTPRPSPASWPTRMWSRPGAST